MRVMLYAAAAAVRCSSLRLSALRTNAARRSVALHATTSAARQARRAAALNDASNPYAGKTVADLKELLRARGLPVSGVKSALLERLAASDGGALAATPPRRADAALKTAEVEAPPPSPPKKSEPTGRPFSDARPEFAPRREFRKPAWRRCAHDADPGARVPRGAARRRRRGKGADGHGQDPGFFSAVSGAPRDRFK